MTLEFCKYHGTGNDFIMIDNRQGLFHADVRTVNLLCDRHMGVGADGLILLEKSEGYDFSMVYYNSDGNESTMCGNGGRCITAFAADLGVIEKQAVFSAVDGDHEAHVLKRTQGKTLVRLRMKDVNGYREHPHGIEIDTGSPHLVVPCNDPGSLELVQEARRIRYSPEYALRGINVNFVLFGDNMMSIRTYERGVEDETLSCGTGVVAAAMTQAITSGSVGEHTYNIQSRGGELRVHLRRRGKAFTDVWLEGPAVFVFKGVIKL